MNSEIIKKFCDLLGEERVFTGEAMSRHTTFKIGGPADYFLMPDKDTDVGRIVKICKESAIPYFILGNGSNLLVGDGGYRGAVIQIYIPQQAAGEISGCRKSPCSSSLYKRRHCLPSVTAQTRLLLFNKCLWLHKQKIKSHHSSAKSATSLTSLTARASWSLFSSPVFCSMFATWNLTVDISQPISAAMRV